MKKLLYIKKNILLKNTNEKMLYKIKKIKKTSKLALILIITCWLDNNITLEK